MNTRLTTRTTTALAASALATALLLSGCSAGATEGAGSTATETAAQRNNEDVLFALMMLPHHEQALEMSDIILAKEGLDPRVADLATQIADAQGPEIETLEGWIAEWEVEAAAGEGHGQHEMDGMLTPEQLDELRAAPTPEAQRLFLEQMIVHHEGAIEMAQAEVDGGSHPDVVAMAQAIVDSQAAEIETMRALLDEL